MLVFDQVGEDGLDGPHATLVQPSAIRGVDLSAHEIGDGERLVLQGNHQGPSPRLPDHAFGSEATWAADLLGSDIHPAPPPGAEGLLGVGMKAFAGGTDVGIG